MKLHRTDVPDLSSKAEIPQPWVATQISVAVTSWWIALRKSDYKINYFGFILCL